MLPRSARIRHSDDFRRVMKRGRRAGGRLLVVHALTEGALTDGALTDADRGAAARAGFVVSKAVGGAVVRHRVSRQLRHLVAERLPLLHPGLDLVVRALPAAAGARSGELGADLDAALRRVGLHASASDPAGVTASPDGTDSCARHR